MSWRRIYNPFLPSYPPAAFPGRVLMNAHLRFKFIKLTCAKIMNNSVPLCHFAAALLPLRYLLRLHRDPPGKPTVYPFPRYNRWSVGENEDVTVDFPFHYGTFRYTEVFAKSSPWRPPPRPNELFHDRYTYCGALNGRGKRSKSCEFDGPKINSAALVHGWRASRRGGGSSPTAANSPWSIIPRSWANL